MDLKENEIDKIVGILTLLKGKEDFKKKFDWNFETDKLKEIIDNAEEVNNIEKQSSAYEKNVELKETLKKYFTKEKNEKLSKWIVKEWGGITTINNFSKILSDLDNQSDFINVNFSDSISSRSKVLSFLDPKKYVICDSRNIFTLNWLLFFAQKDNETIRLFYPLSGRNSTIKKYNLETIVETLLGKKVDYPFKEYSDFCEIIKKLTDKLGFDKIYKTEMFIFSLSKDKNFGIFPYIKKELEEILKTTYMNSDNKNEM